MVSEVGEPKASAEDYFAVACQEHVSVEPVPEQQLGDGVLVEEEVVVGEARHGFCVLCFGFWRVVFGHVTAMHCQAEQSDCGKQEGHVAREPGFPLPVQYVFQDGSGCFMHYVLAGIAVNAAKLGKIMHVFVCFPLVLWVIALKNTKKGFGVKIFLLFLHRKTARQLFCEEIFLLSSVG